MFWPFTRRGAMLAWFAVLYLLLNRATQMVAPVPVHQGADPDYKCVHYCDDPNSPEDN